MRCDDVGVCVLTAECWKGDITSRGEVKSHNNWWVPSTWIQCVYGQFIPSHEWWRSSWHAGWSTAPLLNILIRHSWSCRSWYFFATRGYWCCYTWPSLLASAHQFTSSSCHSYRSSCVSILGAVWCEYVCVSYLHTALESTKVSVDWLDFFPFFPFFLSLSLSLSLSLPLLYRFTLTLNLPTRYYFHISIRFSTLERKLDYIAVMTNIIYGTIFALSCRTLTYKLIWFIGLLVIGILFISNETVFYVQVMKSPLGSEINELVLQRENEQSCCKGTKPNTDEREWVYIRTVWIHLLCVHVLGNALALVIIVGKHNGYRWTVICPLHHRYYHLSCHLHIVHCTCQMLHILHEPSGNDEKLVVKAIEEHPDGKAEDTWACFFILRSITWHRCDNNHQSAHNQGEKKAKRYGRCGRS